MLLVLLLIATSVCAIDVDYSYNVVDNKIVVEKVVDFGEPVTGKYSFSIPSDATGISAYVDGDLKDYDESLIIDNSSEIKLNYVTKKYLDESNFVFDLRAEYDIDNLAVSLVLPENAALKSKIDNRKSTSIFPDADTITTDGKSIVLEWFFDDVSKGENINFFVRYKKQNSYALWILLVLLLLAVFFAARFVVFGKRGFKQLEKDVQPENKTVEESVLEIPEQTGFDRHLKEAEEQVVNILKLKEGSCEQGTLRVSTGFSKATLSRILKELEDRKVVFKEKRGKKNLVFLRKG